MQMLNSVGQNIMHLLRKRKMNMDTNISVSRLWMIWCIIVINE